MPAARLTRLYGVIGHPIAHSLSPAMHTAAFKALGRDALYSAFDVPPKLLKPVLRALALSGVSGLNVTVPLKQAVIPLLDRLDPAAKAIGAVNTIVIQNRRLTGYNTDAKGFAMALRELGWRGKAGHAVILGAGGAARAVAWQLAGNPGMRLTIANRSLTRAQQLVRWLKKHKPAARISAAALKSIRLDRAGLLVNATTVGMKAGDGVPVGLSGLKRGCLVYDLVYNRPTRLVAQARRRGCIAAGGLTMLLYQGAESLRLWTHRRPPVSVMRQALEKAIAGRV